MQVNEIVDLAAAKARKGAHPSWALSTPGSLQQGPGSDAGGLGALRDQSPGAEAAGLDQQASDPSFVDAENSHLRAPSSVVWHLLHPMFILNSISCCCTCRCAGVTRRRNRSVDLVFFKVKRSCEQIRLDLSSNCSGILLHGCYCLMSPVPFSPASCLLMR